MFLRACALFIMLGLVLPSIALPGCPTTTAAPRLYLPLFEVDYVDALGLTTLFSLSNASDTTKLARINIFNRSGVYVGMFHLALQPQSVRPINLKRVLTSPGLSVCEGDPVLGVVDVQHLRRELSSTDGVARGYLVIDTVEGCQDATFSTDPEHRYMESLSDDSLSGDWFFVAPGSGDDGAAQGNLLAARLRGGRHRVRFVGSSPGFDGTDLVLSFPEGEPPDRLTVTAWNEEGDARSVSRHSVPLRAFRFDVAQLELQFEFGHLEIDCGSQFCWLGAVFRGQNRFSVSVPSVALDCGSK